MAVPCLLISWTPLSIRKWLVVSAEELDNLGSSADDFRWRGLEGGNAGIPTDRRLRLAPPKTQVTEQEEKTIKDLVKEAGYSKREMRRSNRKATDMQHQLACQSSDYATTVAQQQAKLMTKSEECNKFAAMLQQRRRREGNLYKQQADARVTSIQAEADAKIIAAQSSANDTRWLFTWLYLVC